MAEATLAPELEVEQEGAVSLEEAIELAERAINNIKPEMQAGEVFPGSNAYNSVMRAVVMAGESNNKVIENWHMGYDELAEHFDYTDPEKSVAELKERLEEFLASVKAKLGQGVERGQSE